MHVTVEETSSSLYYLFSSFLLNYMSYPPLQLDVVTYLTFSQWM